MYHAVVDGLTLASFFKSWAHMCKHLGLAAPSLPEHLIPFFDRTFIKDQAELGALFSKQYQSMDGPNNKSLKVWDIPAAPQDAVRCTFEFTRVAIQTLRRHVMSIVGSDTLLRLSTFALMFAYTWVCLVEAENIKADEARITFPADCRSRLDPSVPNTYFGNCISGRLVVAKTKALLGEHGLVVALSVFTEAMNNLDEGVLIGAEHWVSRLSTMRTGKLVGIAGSPNFRVYDTDFGWGATNKYDIVSIDRTGAISVSETKNGDGGVRIGLVLKKHQMDVFASAFAKGLKPNSRI